MVFLEAEVTGSSAIRPQVVSDQSIGNETVFLQQLAHELHRGMLVPLRLDQHIEDLALRVDGAPQVDHAAIDLEIDLIQMPARVGVPAQKSKSTEQVAFIVPPPYRRGHDRCSVRCRFAALVPGAQPRLVGT